MFKRIMLSIFGGITIFGLLLVVIGFAMGGRVGYITASNTGDVIYYADGQSYTLANMPAWLGRNISTKIPLAPNAPNAPALPGASGTTTYTERESYADSDVQSLTIYIDAGYLVIKTGPEVKLEVDGALPYESEIYDGDWVISAQASGVHSRYDNGWSRTRFWMNNNDVTTTFTITVPQELDDLTINLGMGEADISGFNTEYLSAQTDLGEMKINDVTADYASLTVNLGSIKAKNFTADETVLACDLGSIDLEGELTGNVDVECSLGSVEMKLERPESYSWNAEVGLGSVQIDGNSAAGLSSGGSGGDTDALPYFNLDCGLGSINVKFK